MPVGRLLFIPIPITDDGLDTIPRSTMMAMHGVRHFVAERARTARRYFSRTRPPYAISDLDIIEMDKHADRVDTAPVLSWLEQGHDVAVVSESGCPGIADPGAVYAAAAHERGIEVVPYVGPSSIILALMASGLNGQDFAFVGYLPIDRDQLSQRLRSIDRQAASGQTQIWIETPYRNDKHLQVLLKKLSPHLRLCIATDITADSQSIITMRVSAWAQKKHTIGKKNTIFLVGR